MLFIPMILARFFLYLIWYIQIWKAKGSIFCFSNPYVCRMEKKRWCLFYTRALCLGKRHFSCMVVNEQVNNQEPLIFIFQKLALIAYDPGLTLTNISTSQGYNWLIVIVSKVGSYLWSNSSKLSHICWGVSWTQQLNCIDTID